MAQIIKTKPSGSLVLSLVAAFLLVAAVASEVVLRFVLDNSRQSWSATLRDFAIRPMEAV